MSFIKRLVKIAPVYYALGNHELEYMQNQKSEDLLDEIKSTGAILLEQKYKDIKVKGMPVRIGGMYGYAFDPNGTTKKDDMSDGIYDFLKDFENTSSYKIMMSHRPDSFIFGEASKAWDIDLFSDTHASYFVVIFALFVGVYLLRAFRRKQLQMVYFNDIDSVYPLFLCLLMAFSATVYESMQVFVPDTWEHFYFNPTLSPFKVPFILSVFLLSIWLFVIVSLAVLDDLFRQLTPAAAIFYLLGLMSCCIFCYFFFILMAHIYIGYLFLILFILVFVKKVYRNSRYKYCCGHCGEKLKEKGVCPHCGAINE